VLNVTIGFRVDTNGDAIDVDFNNFEAAAFSSSPIATGGATRPADALPYSVGDVVGSSAASGGVIELPSVGMTDTLGVIQSLRLRMSGTALPTGMAGGFRVHFFNAAPGAVADNAPFATAAGERSSYIDYIDTSTLEVIGGGFLARSANYCGVPFRLMSTSLWAEIVTLTNNGFTPVSGASIDLVATGIFYGGAQ
jgi:hypothetical protein